MDDSTKTPFQSKFDKPHRLKGFDYSSVTSYLLTFNTLNRKNLLSEIIPGDILTPPHVELKPFGEVTEKYILRIESCYPGVILENYVIMPDHVHLLISIEKYVPPSRKDKPKVAVIVQSLKSLVTKEIGQKIWQLDFYDTIADNEDIFIKCDDYITNNPAVWLDRNGIEPKDPKE